MKIILKPARNEWYGLVERPKMNSEDLSALVKSIFSEVKENGDGVLLKYTQQYDNVVLNTIKITQEELLAAQLNVKEELKQAIQLAANNIRTFHASQMVSFPKVETTKGVVCWQESRPIESIGLYIPGGTAPLFSTVLMLGIPAQIAGCKQIVLCTPPNKEGKIADEILYVAKLIGITEIYKVGGVQAIAAMTYGTESIPKVLKIFGPGNQYVTAAKQEAFQNGVAIDMPAGPSELMVVADETANPQFVASDLLSQAEHGTDSQVVCVANSIELIREIKSAISEQVEQLPRKNIALQALNNSKLIVMEAGEETLNFINEYAPEHLILSVCNEKEYLKGLRNAGSVFLGNYTPESAGDYASGTNHTLPTNGFSKAFSGVNMDAYVKKITFQKITKEGIQNIGKQIELMAEAEQLQAHKNAVTLRLNEKII